MLKNFYLSQSLFVIRTCQLLTLQSGGVLVLYFVLAMLSGVFEGAGMLLLANIVTGKFKEKESTSVIENLVSTYLPQNDLKIIFTVMIIFLTLKVIFTFASQIIYYRDIQSGLKKKIRYSVVKSLMNADWEGIRNMRVGMNVGTVTEEVTKVASYFYSLILMIYSLINAVLLTGMSFFVSLDVTLLLLGSGIPMFFVFKFIMKKQKAASDNLTSENQEFYARMTETLSGMYHIKVEGEVDQYKNKMLRRQDSITEMEVKYSYSIASANAFLNFMPALILFCFFLWVVISGRLLEDYVGLLASVGVIGSRALTHINTIVQQISGLSLSASGLIPVEKILKLVKEKERITITEPIRKIEVTNATYLYNESSGIKNIQLDINIGSPLFIMGPSGAGKTTLANLISGLYQPVHGKIKYIGISDQIYDSGLHRPKVGYVTQDIHLFHGTIRENLVTASREVPDDKELWDALRKVEAEEFISNLGGLDSVIAEAGRSLSGGQKRRLGIARVLIGKPELLILDEVTAGLDTEIRAGLLRTIQDLSRFLIVILITHEDIRLENADYYYLK